MLDLTQHPHRRFNLLNGSWVLVSPHRTDRPWQGQVEKTAAAAQPEYDPNCYLCPGNSRAGGARNPPYTSTFVFDNDFAALLAGHARGEPFDRDGLLIAAGEPGICRVGCFSPRHDLTVARMSVADLTLVVDVWAAQYAELGRQPGIGHVQIFENRGEMMGASNPHPHCQIWASSSIPTEVAAEQREQAAWARGPTDRACCAITWRSSWSRASAWSARTNPSRRWSRFGRCGRSKTMIVSKRHLTAMDEFDQPSARLADILKRVTTRYDNVFRGAVSLQHGLSPAAHRWRGASGVALPRALLSAAAALRDHPEIYGRLRDAGHAAAGHHRRERRRAPARHAGDPLPRFVKHWRLM
jgi:UDPglucose--hexose-1-phosphate uridylyltransferase